MLDLVRWIIVIAGLTGIVLGVIAPSGHAFDKLKNMGLAVMVIQVTQALIFSHYLSQWDHLHVAVPYALLYGPLFYVAQTYENNGRINGRSIIYHLLPVAAAFWVFLILLLHLELRRQYLEAFTRLLYYLIPISFLIYGLWGCLRTNNNTKSLNSNVLAFIAVFMLAFACFLITIKFTRPVMANHSVEGMVVYGFRLVSTLLLTFYSIRRAMERGILRSLSGSGRSSSYTKSTFPDHQGKLLKRDIIQLLEQERLYLNPHLSLIVLADNLNISTHQLSQVLGSQFQRNFNELINSYRVKESCRLMKDAPQTPLEEIALNSGFNSRITFHRNFKKLMNCTPSEYKRSILENG